MRVLIDTRGQTCNNYWCYVYPISDCLENGGRYYLPYYDITIGDYPNMLGNPYLKFPFYSERLNRKYGIRKYMDFLVHFFTNRFYQHATLFRKFPGTFIDGWATRLKPVPESALPEIRRIFTPSPVITTEMDALFSEVRRDGGKVIGIHIRRGDYKDWRGGKYYYSVEQYAGFCRTIADLFAGQDVTFFLASNEDIDISLFEGLKVFRHPAPSATYDLYGLSQCDRIAGPPSSFSRFAAFIGGRPIAFITDPGFKTPVFRTLKGYGVYSDGTPVEFEF